MYSDSPTVYLKKEKLRTDKSRRGQVKMGTQPILSPKKTTQENKAKREALKIKTDSIFREKGHKPGLDYAA